MLISSGWPLWNNAAQYWEVLLNGIREISRFSSCRTATHIRLVDAAKLLFHGGAGWCDAASQCFTKLIELFALEDPTHDPFKEEQLDWLLSTCERNSPCSLQQLCVWRVRKALANDLPHKITQMALPHLIHKQLTLNDVVGDLAAQYLKHDFRAFTNWKLLRIFFYVLETPSLLYTEQSLPNGSPGSHLARPSESFSLMEFLALRTPPAYFYQLQGLFAVFLRAEKNRVNLLPEKEQNLHLLAGMLGAALNLAILHHSNQLVEYLLDQLGQISPRPLIASRSPFLFASLLVKQAPELEDMPSVLRNSLVEPLETTANCSALLVAFLCENDDALEVFRCRQTAFASFQVSSLHCL